MANGESLGFQEKLNKAEVKDEQLKADLLKQVERLGNTKEFKSEQDKEIINKILDNIVKDGIIDGTDKRAYESLKNIVNSLPNAIDSHVNNEYYTDINSMKKWLIKLFAGEGAFPNIGENVSDDLLKKIFGGEIPSDPGIAYALIINYMKSKLVYNHTSYSYMSQNPENPNLLTKFFSSEYNKEYLTSLNNLSSDRRKIHIKILNKYFGEALNNGNPAPEEKKGLEEMLKSFSRDDLDVDKMIAFKKKFPKLAQKIGTEMTKNYDNNSTEKIINEEHGGVCRTFAIMAKHIFEAARSKNPELAENGKLINIGNQSMEHAYVGLIYLKKGGGFDILRHDVSGYINEGRIDPRVEEQKKGFGEVYSKNKQSQETKTA